MDSHVCQKTSSTELIAIIFRILKDASQENSPMLHRIASRITNISNDSSSTACRRVTMSGWNNNPFPENIDEARFKGCFDSYPEEMIYQMVFDVICHSELYRHIASHVFCYVLAHGEKTADEFLRVIVPTCAPQLSSSPIKEQLFHLNKYCGGLVTFCDDTSCRKISIEPKVKKLLEEGLKNGPRWVYLYPEQKWKPTWEALSRQHTVFGINASLQHLVEAFGDRTPCPDDESMAELLKQHPELWRQANTFGKLIQYTQHRFLQLPNIDQIVKTIQAKNFLPSLLQVRSTNKQGLNSWSQHFPETVSATVWAASEGCDHLLLHILGRNNDSTLEDFGSDRKTALAAAAQNGHFSTVEILLAKGANINAPDLMNDTPLALAAAGNTEKHVEIVNLLINRGANINSRAHDGATPIIAAAASFKQGVSDKIIGLVQVAAGDQQEAASHASDNNGESMVSHKIRNWPNSDPDFYSWQKGGSWTRKFGNGNLKAVAAVHRAIYYSWRGAGDYLNGLVLESDPKKWPVLGYVPGELRKRFVFSKTLGRGAFGVCVKATDRSTGRVYAVKASQFWRSVDREELRQRKSRERSELDLLQRFNHPNVASLQGFFQDKGFTFMVFEMADTDLEKYFFEHTMTEDEIRNMMRQLFTGTGYLHDKGLIHCDLKPANILVYDGGKTFRLTDLGNSTFVQDLQTMKLDMCCGTQCYASPEANENIDRASRKPPLPTSPIDGPACDIWSLGVIFFEAFAWKFEWEDHQKMIFEMVKNAAGEPLGAQHVHDIEQRKKGFFKEVYSLVSKGKILNEEKYKSRLPIRVDNFIEWMHAPAADERPTIEQCLSNFWIRCEPEYRMTPQQLADLDSYLKKNKPKGSRREIREAEREIIACVEDHKLQMRDYDVGEVEDTMAALPKISPYTFLRMVFSIRDSHGETVEAIWNGYPRQCSKSEEHPFTVETCFWCGHSRKEYLLKLAWEKEEEEKRLRRDSREERKLQRQQKWEAFERCAEVDTDEKRESKKGKGGGKIKEAVKIMTRRRRERAENQNL